MDHNKWLMTNLQYHKELTSRLADQSIVRISYQFFEESRINRLFRSPERRVRTENVDAFGFSIDFKKSLNNSAQFSYGIESNYNNVSSQGESVNLENNQLAPINSTLSKIFMAI